MGITNYGFFTRYREQEQQQGLAFLPCASGCRGSDSDPRHCQCVCRGLNHGLLLRPRQFQVERPVPVPQGYNPYLPLQQQPEPLALPHYREQTPEEKRQSVQRMPEVRAYHALGKVGKKIGKNFAKAMLGRVDESELNLSIMNGLRKQFSEERVNAIVDESFSEHYSHLPESNRPELYELYESGFIDKVLERRNIRWVVGRPRRK
jgi:hypothetical protein